VDYLQETFVKTFANRIREVRIQLGLSQAAVARKWGLPKQTIWAWENGTRTPSGLYKEKIEKILRKIEQG
jgi:DNA-binding XRE family transcriptional regulator